MHSISITYFFTVFSQIMSIDDLFNALILPTRKVPLSSGGILGRMSMHELFLQYKKSCIGRAKTSKNAPSEQIFLENGWTYTTYSYEINPLLVLFYLQCMLTFLDPRRRRLRGKLNAQERSIWFCCIVLCSMVQCCAALCCKVLWCVVLYCAVLCCVVKYGAMMCCVIYVSCCFVLCYAVWVVLYFVVLAKL